MTSESRLPESPSAARDPVSAPTQSTAAETLPIAGQPVIQAASAPATPSIRGFAPFVDIVGIILAAVAWQQILAWASWVWLLPGSALGIGLAAGTVAAASHAAIILQRATETGATRFPPQAMLAGLAALVGACGMIWHALWVMPEDMLGLGFMTALLTAVFISRFVPDSLWHLRLLLNGAVVAGLFWVTNLQRLPPLFHGAYIAALVVVVIMATRGRQNLRKGVPQEIFGSLVFALGVGIAPSFMAAGDLGSWLGREFLACLLVMTTARLMFSWARLSQPAATLSSIDDSAWIQRWPPLRSLLPVVLATCVIVGGLMLAEQGGRSRWLGLAVITCSLWQVPAALWLKNTARKPQPPLLHALAMAWIALGPATGPALIWWGRNLLT